MRILNTKRQIFPYAIHPYLLKKLSIIFQDFFNLIVLSHSYGSMEELGLTQEWDHQHWLG